MTRKKDSEHTDEISELEQKVLTDLTKANLSDKERKVLLQQLKSRDPTVSTHEHRLSDTHTQFFLISDTHMGHKEFKEDLFDIVCAYAKKLKPDVIYHVGDITEGMSSRPGHCYELTHIGTTAQIDYAAKVLAKSPVKIAGITGNHDQWAYKAVGMDVGVSLEDKLGKDKFEYLGMNEADIMISKGVKLKLFHANDGSAYAQSYKLQKLMESFTGGEKPHLLAEGHYHKALYMFNRNIHGFESGTLCGQTPWMRGKKLAANVGFWIVDVYFKNKGKEIQDVSPRFVPYYVE